MIGSNNKITKGQNAAMIITTIIGVGILSLPSTLAEKFGPDGWIPIIIGSIIVSLIVAIITKLTMMFYGKTMVEFGRELVSTPISDIISVIYLFYVLVFIAYIARIFAEVAKMFLLKSTPTEVIIITMLLTSAFLVRKGIESIARMMQIIIPIVIIPLLILVLTIIPDLQLDNLLPIFRTNFKDIIKGLPLIFFSYLGFEILLFSMAYVDRPKKSLRYNLMAIWSITLIYLLIFFVTLARFGEKEMIHLLWPTLSLMKTIDFPGAFIENVEGIVMSLWVLMVLSTIAVYFYIGVLTMRRLARGKESNYYVLPLVPIIYFLSLVPDNIAATYEYMDIFINYVATFLTIIVPVVFFIVALIRKGKASEAK